MKKFSFLFFAVGVLFFIGGAVFFVGGEKGEREVRWESGVLFFSGEEGGDVGRGGEGAEEEIAAAGRRLAEAEIEMRVFLEKLETARQTIEEAIVMVREQKENYDFAFERYEKLMPLVETGALEPLAASQIQSAYISARAAFAQAKFLLSQAVRDFGSEEGRRLRHAQLQRKIEAAKAGLQKGEILPKAGGVKEAVVVAYFPEEEGAKILLGDEIEVVFAVLGEKPVRAKAVEVFRVSGVPGWKVKALCVEEPPFSDVGKEGVLPCRVRVVNWGREGEREREKSGKRKREG